MKRLFYRFLKTICSLFARCNRHTTSVQQPCIKFLGIPVDGTKSKMISKLKAKGYKYDPYNDCLDGEFNGEDVLIVVRTVKNRVWRIAVADQSFTDETSIKDRFNTLLEQFSNNTKYTLFEGSKLDEHEDISNEMLVHNKRYDVGFKYTDENIHGSVWYTIDKLEDDVHSCVIPSKYRIVMFYDNLNNAADGSEL